MTMPKPVAFAASGGLDLVTPEITIPPGRVIASLNYEPVAAGYQRIRGFERFSGLPSPSATQTYYTLAFTTGAGCVLTAPAIGTILYDGISGAAFTLMAVTITSGSFAAQTAVGTLTLIRHDSTATAAGHDINIYGGAKVCVASANFVAYGGSTTALDAAAPALLRANIAAVPGSGPIRGILYENGNIYAVRDNLGATAAVIWQAGPYGWVSTNVMSTWCRFDQGGIDGVQLVEGALYDATSGAGTALNGTPYRVVLQSGSWSAGTATGYIVGSVSAWSIGNYLYDSVSGSALRVCRISSTPVTFTLPAGGTYKTITYNFYGSSNLSRSYFTNGVGNACELYYGIVGGVAYLHLHPIFTGMTSDLPVRCAVHRNTLFLSFAGGSLQSSSVGNPFSWSPLTGASEIGIGDEITGLQALPNSLAVLGANSINVLYGNDSTDYQLQTFTRDAGALANSAQTFGDLIYMDNRGIRALSSAQNYGNFNMGTISRLIEPLIIDLRTSNVIPSASFIRREKDQYWVILSDGTALVVYMGSRRPQLMRVNLGKTINVARSLEWNGQERIFLGGSDGYVYEFDKGTSFDSGVIESYLRFPFFNAKSPSLIKRLSKVVVDVRPEGAASLSISCDFDFGTSPGTATQVASVTPGGSSITSLGTGESYYTGKAETQAAAYLDGLAENFSLKIGGSSSTEAPWTITGATFYVVPERQAP